MSEINNNNFKPQVPVNPKLDPKPVAPKTEEIVASKEEVLAQSPKIDLPSIGLPGRSQVKPSENVNSDIDFFLKNPEMVEKANEFFDMVYEQLKQNDQEKEKKAPAYETAAQITNAYVKEFLN